MKDQAEWADAFYEKANDGIIWVAASDIGVTVTEKRLERSRRTDRPGRDPGRLP